MMRVRMITLRLVLTALAMISCLAMFPQLLFNDLEDGKYGREWINVRIDSGYAYSGHYLSTADSLHPFGLGYQGPFPGDLNGKNSLMTVDGQVRSSRAHDRAVFVISIQHGDQTVFWKNIRLDALLDEAGHWAGFQDSLVVPGRLVQQGVLKAYLWNSDQRDTVAIDDLRFRFKTIQNPTFLPENLSMDLQRADTSGLLLASNAYYTVYYDEDQKAVSCYTPSGEPLISNIRYFTRRHSKGNEFESKLPLSWKKTKKNKENTSLIFRVKDQTVNLTVEMICHKESPEIQFRIREKYTRDQLVTRESLVFQSAPEAVEVYRSNRQSDADQLQTEYWLDRQGVRFGKDKTGWHIYRPDEVSSLQLSTAHRQLWVNLDFAADHPLVHFPQQDDTSDLKEDWSPSHYGKKTRRSYAFTIHAGVHLNSLPRFMKNPSGRLAAYIWTEHADYTSMATNRAVYFGSENISRAEAATGGFARYNIPVTKSVFFANPDSITNQQVSSGRFPDPLCTIRDDSVFTDFLQQLHREGHEICLHTPEEYTSSREMMTEALQYMERQFGSASWIDHGYNNRAHNNRENLVCDGLLKSSPNYSLDLWQFYGIRYLWNPYYEDYGSFDRWQFGQLIPKPYPGFGDHFPVPGFWQHPTRSGELYHWPTRSVIFPGTDGAWDFLLNEAILAELVNTWSVEINHCYPAWTDPARGFWHTDPEGTLAASPGFERALGRMASLRDSGMLNLVTVGGFLDYQLAIEQLEYHLQPDGRIMITNPGSTSIKGLSMAVKAGRVLVNDLLPEHYRRGGDIIFWFDLPAKGTAMIRTIP